MVVRKKKKKKRWLRMNKMDWSKRRRRQ